MSEQDTTAAVLDAPASDAATPDATKPRHVRIVTEGNAQATTVYLDGVPVRYCHRLSFTSDANATGLARFALLTLEIVTFDAEIVGPMAVEERGQTLDELRAARRLGASDEKADG